MDFKLNVKIISQSDLVKAGCFDIPEIIDTVEDAFRLYANGSVIFPDKVSVIFDDVKQSRINCLPAAIPDENVYGMKWVSVFPSNPKEFGRPNLSAVYLLSELTTGFPIAFMDGTLCSNLRTASVGAVAARYLARQNSEVIGFIGGGEEAKAHFMTFASVLKNLKVCKVASRTSATEKTFISTLSKLYPHISFEECGGDYKKAAENSDVIITAISGQEMILKADWIKPGAFYCHVAGLEDEYAVALKADKIVCDDWSVVKHRTQTISRMYKEHILSDENIYANLFEIVAGGKKGRETDTEFIYFNSVGMSYVDVHLSHAMYKKCVSQGCYSEFCLQQRSMFEIPRNLIKL